MFLTYHGHSCFEIRNEKFNLLIDPFITGNPLAKIEAESLKPDFILVTHGHGDHLGDAIEIAKKTGAVIIAVNELAIYCQKAGAKVHPMHIGGGFNFPFGRVKLTPAWHSSAVIGDSFVFTGNPCGFIIEMEDKKIYHAGDTGLFGDMKLIGELNQLDIALLPIGDNYVMGPEDALIAARFLNAKLVIPMHYNTFDIIRQNPKLFIEALNSENINGRIMEIGEKIEA